MKRFLVALAGLMMTWSVFAQDSTFVKPHFYGGADLTSNLIWRGMKWADNPTISPNLGFGVAGFNVYLCGAYAWEAEYAEFDMAISYEWKGLKIEVMDYFYPHTSYMARYAPDIDPTAPNFNFLNYKQGETGHQLDVMLSYAPDYFPLHAMWSTIVYGDDFNYFEVGTDPESGDPLYDIKQAYSSYAEIGYWHEFGDYGVIDFTLGASILRSDAIYGNEKFGLTNISLNYSKTFETKHLEFPVFAQLSYNAVANCPYLTIGAGFSF